MGRVLRVEGSRQVGAGIWEVDVFGELPGATRIIGSTVWELRVGFVCRDDKFQISRVEAFDGLRWAMVYRPHSPGLSYLSDSERKPLETIIQQFLQERQQLQPA